uniref:IQ domain-containing protein C n=1 Tax=Monopterus albus TaxID=43700 RepID=UPI0009B3F2BB|nr:IQ domain-containing protein C-like [Monopterus albus]
MDRIRWEEKFTYFQAFARGYLVRNEVRRARQDFEDIVQEIDGGLSHLQWREAVISIPHFTDSHGPLLGTSNPSDPGLDVGDSTQSPAAAPPAAAAPPLSQETERHVLLEKIEAERDDSQTKGQACPSRDCFPSSYVGGDGEGQIQKGFRNEEGETDGGMTGSTTSTSIWSSLDLDMSYGHSHKGSHQYCLAQEVPRTPEALRLHRNTLTMELLWLQQAIDSRKKYLSLKDRLTIS